MFTCVTIDPVKPVVKSTTKSPLAEPPLMMFMGGGAGTGPNVTFDSSKGMMVSALAAGDPTNTAYGAMIENAASAALSFDFMSRSPPQDTAAVTSLRPSAGGNPTRFVRHEPLPPVSRLADIS